MKLLAPAKINLGLRVLGRRPDGYHELDSLLLPLDLADEIELALRPAARTSVAIEVAGDVDPDAAGAEGGTGAAPLEFSNSLGMPARDGWMLVHNALTGTGLRDQITIIASGKILTGFDMARALALGADLCASARGMMLALGCIQALRCHSGHCPTGITTQNEALVAGLDLEDKTIRVSRYQDATVRSLLELLGAMGISHPDQLAPRHIFRRVSDCHPTNLQKQTCS